MEYILLAVVRLIDSVLGTAKTIFTQKNRATLAALSVILTNLIFFRVTKAVLSADSSISMWVASVTSGLGTYLAIHISRKLSKETVYINTITSDDKRAVSELCTYLRSKKIKNLVTDSYTKEWSKTLTVTVFAETKEQSRLVDDYIRHSPTKFLRYVK